MLLILLEGNSRELDDKERNGLLSQAKERPWNIDHVCNISAHNYFFFPLPPETEHEFPLEFKIVVKYPF